MSATTQTPVFIPWDAAAAEAIKLHNSMTSLEPGQPARTDLYHLLASLLEWSDARGVDFDDVLSAVRADWQDIRG